MRRRDVLSALGFSGVTAFTGCLGIDPPEAAPSAAVADPYPISIECGTRGMSETVPQVTVTEPESDEYACLRQLPRAQEAVKRELESNLENLGPVWGQEDRSKEEGVRVSHGGSTEVGGTFVQVYYLDRYCDERTPAEFSELVGKTPHTAEVQSEARDLHCEIPVYVLRISRSGVAV